MLFCFLCGCPGNNGESGNILGSWEYSLENSVGFDIQVRMDFEGTASGGGYAQVISSSRPGSGLVEGCVASGGSNGTWQRLGTGRLQVSVGESISRFTGCMNPGFNSEQTMPPTTLTFGYRVSGDQLTLTQEGADGGSGGDAGVPMQVVLTRVR